MKLLINGQTKEVPDAGHAQSVAGLVAQFCKHKKNIMAEVNGRIIAPADWEKTAIKEGDAVELVAFVGGG